MKRKCVQFASIVLIMAIFSTMCLAYGDASTKIQYKSVAECVKYGITDINIIRDVCENQDKTTRATQLTETDNNRSFSTADTIPVYPTAGSETHMFGTLYYANTEDYYKITPPRHGRVYVMILSPTGYTYTVDIYDSSYNSFDYDVGFYSGNKSFMTTKGSTTSSTLPSYYIKVTSSTGYTTNQYRVIVFYALNYQKLNCVYPTTNTLTNITSPVGYRYLGKHEYHPGVDIPGSTSDTIYSICDSVVIRSYNQTYLSDGSLGMGQFVQAVTFFSPDSEYDDILDEYTDTWYAIRYMHLSERYVNTVSTFTGVQEIAKGEPIGKMGNTGYSTGVHLHIDINNGGHYLTNDIENDRQSIINPVDLYNMSFTGSVY